MTKRMYTGYESITIVAKVVTTQPQKIIVKAYNEGMANTYFTNRFAVVSGEKFFYIRMPVSGLVTVLDIYNEANGNVASDPSFQITQLVKTPLVRKTHVVDFMDAELKSYIKFCTRFCYNAGTMPPGVYKSNDGRFTIDYLADIRSSQTGEALGTPARINKDTGVIQASQAKFVPMTFPMRMAIMLHEFSHFYRNSDINDETEADKNALLIYLGLGYPRIEACEAFLDTFIKSANGPRPLSQAQMEGNSRRYNIIHKYIQDFEKQNSFFKD